MFSKQIVAQKEKELRQAAADAKLDVVKSLIDKDGVNVNAVAPASKRTALHWAAKNNHENIVSYLLEKKALLTQDADDQNAFGLTSNSKIKSILITRFKEIGIGALKDTELYEAKKSNYGFEISPEIVIYIRTGCANGAALKQAMKLNNLTGDSYLQGIPISIAVSMSDENWIKNGKLDCLLEQSTNLNLTAHPLQIGTYQNTLLHGLLANELISEAITVMNKAKKLNLTIDTTVQDVNGRTILHLAALLRSSEFISDCIAKFGNTGIDVQDSDKMTALHFAYLFGDKQTLDVLEKAGAKPDLKNAQGNIPQAMLDLPLKEVTTALQNFHINPQRKTVGGKILIAEIVEARLAVQKNVSKEKQGPRLGI